MIEQKFIASNGVEVIYKQKRNKYDFKHLIFVFSGFLNEKPGNYDFINAMNACPAEVIWINDQFEKMYTYYLCINMDFSVEDAVTQFIRNSVENRGLSLNQVTVTGYSKGGSAALYYGLKLNIPNIVVSVPQTHIGSYVNANWKHVAQHMMGGNFQQAQIHYLDKLIVGLLKKESNFDRNIYLLTSAYDSQYKKEIEPYLNDFRKYSNFNLLKTYSSFVREHNQVTSHHTALLLSIYYALASEATPRFNQGEVNFIGSQPIPKPDSVEGKPYVDLRTFDYNDNILFIDGCAILRGVHLVEYSDISYEIIFIDQKSKKQFAKLLAKAHRPNLTRELFENDFVIYDKGWFTTYQYKGVNISDLPKGKYALEIKIIAKGMEMITPLRSEKLILKEEKEFSFECNQQSATITLK